MNRAEALNFTVQSFAAFMDAGHPTIPVAYPDVNFDPPPAGEAWVRFSLQWSGTLAAGPGMIEDRHTGMAFVELWFPSGVGYRDVNDMAEAVAEFFRTFTGDGGRLRTNRPDVSTPPSQPGYTRRTVNVPIRLIQPL